LEAYPTQCHILVIGHCLKYINVKYISISTRIFMSSIPTTGHLFENNNEKYTHPEDGGRMDLWNVGILPQNYMASYPGRPLLQYYLQPRCLKARSKTKNSYQYKDKTSHRKTEVVHLLNC